MLIPIIGGATHGADSIIVRRPKTTPPPKPSSDAGWSFSSIVLGMSPIAVAQLVQQTALCSLSIDLELEVERPARGSRREVMKRCRCQTSAAPFALCQGERSPQNVADDSNCLNPWWTDDESRGARISPSGARDLTLSSELISDRSGSVCR